MTKLRDYQNEAVSKTLTYIKDKSGNPLIVAPTGSGKSLMIADLCKKLEADSLFFLNLNRPPKILILAHRKELLTQNAAQIRKLGYARPVSFYANSLKEKDLSGSIVLGSIASIGRLGAFDLPAFDYIIIDEAHLVNNVDSGMYRKLIAALPHARIIGFSATPFRLKGGFLHKGPESIFTDIVYDIPVIRLIERGYLSPLVSKASVHAIDTKDLHMRAGDFIQSEYDSILNEDELIKKTVADIIKHAGDRKSWLIFCSSVNHARRVQDELAKKKISGFTLTGETNHKERDVVLSLFKEGIYKFITNCDVLTVGFDAPNIDMIAILRPTKSPGLYIQMVGRGTRIAPGKRDCLVLDYGGNIERFGPIDRIKLKASDFGKIEVESIPFKVCPECREVIDLKLKICSSCCYTYPVRAVVRTLTHASAASNLSILKTSLMRLKFDGVQILQIYDYKFQIHKKSYRPNSIKIDYYVSNNEFVSEWICPEHTGFARTRAENWWREAFGSGIAPKTCEEFLLVKDSLKLPVKIVVAIQGDYPAIVNKYFDKEHEFRYNLYDANKLSQTLPQSQ